MISMRTQNVRVRLERDGRASETEFSGLRSLRGSHAFGKSLGNLKKVAAAAAFSSVRDVVLAEGGDLPTNSLSVAGRVAAKRRVVAVNGGRKPRNRGRKGRLRRRRSALALS